jgi:hypothetical protein
MTYAEAEALQQYRRAVREALRGAKVVPIDTARAMLRAVPRATNLGRDTKPHRTRKKK